MIGKAMQAITAIAIPTLSAACVLSAADDHLFSSGASTSSLPSSSRVILLACTDYFQDPNGIEAKAACEYSTDGCPTRPPETRRFCIIEQVMQSQMTPGPSPSDLFKPKPKPLPEELGPEIARDLGR